MFDLKTWWLGILVAALAMVGIAIEEGRTEKIHGLTEPHGEKIHGLTEPSGFQANDPGVVVPNPLGDLPKADKIHGLTEPGG